jgi:hypothetical protein
VVQVNANGRTQAHSGGTSQRVALKPTPVAQADFGRNLKPAPVAKLFVFSDFPFALAFRKVLFIFLHLKSLNVAQSRLLLSHIKVRSMRQSKVDFGLQVASQSPLRAAQSRLWFLSRILKSTLPATKVTFGRI